MTAKNKKTKRSEIQSVCKEVKLILIYSVAEVPLGGLDCMSSEGLELFIVLWEKPITVGDSC